MVKHDENKDLRLISRIAKVDYSNKTIKANKSTIIGIKTWGRIDYLTHYCGWFFIYDNSVVVKNIKVDDDEKSTKNTTKKVVRKETSGNNKKKRK